MIRLGYFSSVAPGRPSTGDRAPILATSRRNNVRVGVTGMLLFHKDNYLQILEGPRASVLRLFATVEADPRHTGVTQIFEEPASFRDFPDVSMGFHDLGAPGAGVVGFAEFLREHFDLGALPPSGARALFGLFKPVMTPCAESR